VRVEAVLCLRRHCEPTGPREARPDGRLREAAQTAAAETTWIASSLTLLAMTMWSHCPPSRLIANRLPTIKR